MFLQLKQARRSVLAQYVHGESAWHAHQGQRVVEYQQALQTVSDPLLGWTTVDGRQYYVRQFRNMKGTVPLDSIDGAALADYAGIVGHLLAKGHARTSGASMIAGYVGPRTSSTGRWPGSPGCTPTRPRPTTRPWSRPPTGASCPSSGACERDDSWPSGQVRRGRAAGPATRPGRCSAGSVPS